MTSKMSNKVNREQFLKAKQLVNSWNKIPFSKTFSDLNFHLKSPNRSTCIS